MADCGCFACIKSGYICTQSYNRKTRLSIKCIPIYGWSRDSQHSCSIAGYYSFSVSTSQDILDSKFAFGFRIDDYRESGLL